MTEGLLPDVMHDLFEGVNPSVVANSLDNLVVNRRIDLKKLYYTIENFKYSQNEWRDKPSPVTRTQLQTGKLKQSAAQIW